MTKVSKVFEHDWPISVLGIALAFTVAIGIGFLMGQQTPSAPENMAEICPKLLKSGGMGDCIALRSAIAAEGATSAARWGLWVSFGSLVASAFALVGLMIAFIQGKRTIALATDANRIMMENGQAQARAYVVVQSVECQLNERGHLAARVTFHNSGLSPARRLRWLYNAHLVAIHGESEQRSLTLGDEPDLEKSHWRQDIPSAGSWTSYPLSLRRPNEPEVGTLINQAVFIAVTVKIVADYEDVFGATHREIACFQGRVEAGAAEDYYEELDRAHDDVFDEQTKQIAT